jgi:outer membrane immunogenic protein
MGVTMGTKIKLSAFAAMAMLASSPGYTADLPRKAPPAPPPPAPVATWTGCYIGGNVGWASVETRALFLPAEELTASRDGFAIGGQVGCDYQFAGTGFVVGIQGMADWTDIEATRVGVLFPNARFRAEIESFYTIAARFGYAITPAFLLYGKVGWGAYQTNFTAVNVVTGNVFGGGSDTSRSGLDVGAGGEWAFSPNFSVFIEWDHIFANHHQVIFPNLGPVGSAAIVKRDFDKVLVGLNWRFGRFGGAGAF